MENVILNAVLRKELGKEAIKKLRSQGIIPGIVYKKGKESQTIKINGKELFKTLHTAAGGNVIITLKIAQEKDSKAVKDKTVIVKETQYDPVKGDAIHIDFHEISLTEKITVDVPIEPKGEAAGVKSDGGILDQPLKELHIECLPTQIPQKIEVQVEALKIGDGIRVKELVIPEGVKVLNDPDLTVVSVVPPKVEKPPEEAAAAEEITEPEVIREKKPVEGEEEAPEAEATPPKKEKKEKE